MGLFPHALVIDGKQYLVSGDQKRTPQFTSGPQPAQPGEFAKQRQVQLGRGEAGIVGSYRSGLYPSPHGIAESINGDASVADRYGAGPLAHALALTAAAAGSVVARSGTITNNSTVGANDWTNPGQSITSDNARATTATSGITHYLKHVNMGISLPSGALPTGVKVSVERSWISPLAVDANSAGTGTGATVTVSHTVGGTNRLLLVGVAINGSETISGVTFNGVALSLLIDASDVQAFQVWYLIAPATGAHNIVVTKSAAVNPCVLSAVSLVGAHQTTPFPLSANYGVPGTSTTSTINVPSAAGDLVVDFLTARIITDLTVSGSQAEGSQQASASSIISSSTLAGAATSTAMAWTYASGAAQQAGVAVASIVAPATDYNIRLVIGGTISGDNKADTVTPWPVVDTVKDYGGQNDMWGLGSITKAQAEGATFGVVFSANLASALGTLGVDDIYITVYYTTANAAQPTKIWGDTLDSEGSPARYVYVMHGSYTSVIDPVTDTEVEVKTWPVTVNGGDAARWLGKMFLALRGISTDYVQEISTPFNGSASVYTPADFAAIAIHAGPDALYRAGQDFTANFALVKKTVEKTTVANVIANANWTPSAGETMGDPSTRITRLATLGARLVAGKEDGLSEFDKDFVGRIYLDWMKELRWTYNCNALLPLGQSGDVVAGHRRGLYLLPMNIPVGVEVLQRNATDIKGRYTALNFDGQWIWSWLENPSTLDSYILKMRRRDLNLPGPGLFESHPVAKVSAAQTLTTYLWPGALVNGVRYGPRLYFGSGSDHVSYFKLGETQPMQEDDDAGFTDAWTISWPHDDFGNPGTLKVPYLFGGRYRNVDDTDGVVVNCSVDAGDYLPLDDDGQGGDAAIISDGYHRRFGRKDGSSAGYTLSFQLVGAGGLPALQQRLEGQPDVYILEQPDMVNAYQATCELAKHSGNDADAEEQLRDLFALMGAGVQQVTCQWGEEEGDTELSALVTAERIGSVSSAEATGTVVVKVELHTLRFDDN